MLLTAAFQALANAQEDAAPAATNKTLDLGLGTGRCVYIVNQTDQPLLVTFGPTNAVTAAAAWQFRIPTLASVVVMRGPKDQFIGYRMAASGSGVVSVTTGEGLKA